MTLEFLLDLPDKIDMSLSSPDDQSSPSQVRVTSVSHQGNESDYTRCTAEERIGMMWQLAVDAWAFQGVTVDESRLPRHVVKIIRGKR